MSIFITGLHYKKELYSKYDILYEDFKMYVLCNSCGKEFNDLVKGVRYSSISMGNRLFCSDNCCKDYLNAAGKSK